MSQSRGFARNESGETRDVIDYVKDEPVTALAIAAGIGFCMGGGATTRIGLAMMLFVGRTALRAATTHFIVGAVTGNNDGSGRNFEI